MKINVKSEEEPTELDLARLDYTYKMIERHDERSQHIIEDLIHNDININEFEELLDNERTQTAHTIQNIYQVNS